MRLIVSAALLAGAAAAVALLSAPAEAQQRGGTYVVERNGVMYIGRPIGRAPTRITVRKRSFLDPGSETKTFAQHYHDYALSPSYTVFPSYFDYSVAPGSWSRMPLPGLYDVPGWTRGP